MLNIKKYLCIFLCMLLLLPVLTACGNTQSGGNETTTESTKETEYVQVVVDKNEPLCDGENLKLLAITSSFGINTTQFLYEIAVAEGFAPEKVTVGRLYASGCTLKKHVDHAPDKPLYWYSKITGDPEKCTTPGKWMTVKEEGYGTLIEALQEEDWDIIFIQQSAAQSPIADSYGDYLDQLMGIVHKYKTNPNAKFIWNMTWAYQSDSKETVFAETFHSDQKLMYQTLVDVLKDKIVSRTDFHAIVPSGTAIQNARTSFFGDNLTKDTFHLNNLGRIIAGYTLFSVITGKELTEIKLIQPVESYDEHNAVTLFGIERDVVMEAVNNAIANPYEVTNSSYPTK